MGEINSRALLTCRRDHVGILSAATGGDLARCERWRELGEPIGISKGVTKAARAWFALLDARHKPQRTPLPIHIYQVVDRLLAAEAGEDPHRPPRVRVRGSDGRWAVVEAARLDGIARTIAVSIHAASRDDVLGLVARAYGLTARERELVGLLLDGLDTRELASSMFISRYTVNDHLKSVFAKLGIHSRRELVAGLFGQAA